MADYDIPKLNGEGYVKVPAVKVDALKQAGPYLAKPEFQAELHFPTDFPAVGQLVPDWQARALAKMADLKSRYRSLQLFLDICVKCGACTDKCHYFLGSGDPKNMPVARQDLMRNVYRRYFTFAGKYFPKWVGAVDLTEDVVKDWYNYYHQCSQCRRCSVYCPYGIDTAEISMAGREILDHIGYGQKYSNEIIGKVFKVGNNLGLPSNALADTLEGLEEDVEMDTGIKVRFPLDEEGAEILLVTPSADFFAEPHVDGLIGYAKVLHEAGVTWTLSSVASEAANFGLFIGSYENMRRVALRIREAAIQLKVKRIVFGECGHAWRVAYNFLNTLAGPFDFLDQRYPIPQHILEFTWGEIHKGTLTLDKSANDDKVVTFHDSCNIARGSRLGDEPGGQFVIPRQILQAVCNHYVDMPEGTIHDETFCCGGGGGLLTDDLLQVRIKGAQPRAEALQYVTEQHAVTHMAAVCAICKSQFTKVLPYYGFDREQVVSVHQLVSNAMVLQRLVSVQAKAEADND